MNGTTRRVIPLLLAFAMLLPAPAAAQHHFPNDEDLAVMLRYLVEDGEARGIVLGILEADGSTRVLSHGTAGAGARPVGPRSVFEIGSINKTFTGALLADMVARREVALDDPVSKYLPDSVTVPSRGGREITLLDLATHYSGLPRLANNHTPADMGNPYADYTVETLYAFLANHELRREPGAEGEYSNLGMGLLGHALARAAGSTYRDLLRTRILEPLGMTMTGYALEGEIAEWMTTGHDGDGNEVPFWFGTEAIDGAGGLRSTVEDMLVYLQANVGAPGSDLERAMRDAHVVRREVEGDWNIGLGWQVLRYQGRRLVLHGGGTGGFRTYTGFDPEREVGFVLLTNSQGFDDDIGRDFLRRGPPLDIPEVTVGEEILETYVGRYAAAPGRFIDIRVEDEGTLTMQPPGNVRFRMYAESDTSFFLKRTPWRVRFTKDSTGTVADIVVTIGGVDRTAVRVDPNEPPAGDVPVAEVLDLPLTAEDIARYEGTYMLESGGQTLELHVFDTDGRLYGRTSRTTRLRYQGEHVFIPDFDDQVRLVFTIAGDRAEGVVLHQGGAEIVGRRNPD